MSLGFLKILTSSSSSTSSITCTGSLSNLDGSCDGGGISRIDSLRLSAFSSSSYACDILTAIFGLFKIDSYWSDFDFLSCTLLVFGKNVLAYGRCLL